MLGYGVTGDIDTLSAWVILASVTPVPFGLAFRLIGRWGSSASITVVVYSLGGEGVVK